MATLTQLKEIIEGPHITVSRKRAGIFPAKLYNLSVQIKDIDVDDYITNRSNIILEPETAIFMPGYYEQVIDLQGPGPSLFRLMRNPGDVITLTNQDASISLELSAISARFLFTLFDKDVFKETMRQRGSLVRMFVERMRREGQTPTLRDAFGRILTIRVSTSEESRYRNNRTKLRSIAESSLFNVSYGTGVGLNLSKSWERSYYRLQRRRRQDIQFPRRTYKPDLLAYYQLALPSDSLILAYLALYKILEFFYVSASEKVLHRRLVEELVLPDFSHKKTSKLRELATIVRKFDQRMDEQRMLSTVLQEYFMTDEIVGWVNQYEQGNEQYYTAPQTVLGETLTLDLNPDSVAPSLARRIYHIRNALVHNKEGDLPRFIPFSGQEELLSKEIAIVMFLAEQLIIKTGEDI